MGPYGSQNFMTLLLPQITFEYFQFFSEFSSQLSLQKYSFEFFEFLSFVIFNHFSKFTIVSYGETKNLKYLENERP